ncbi:hypothetical protein ACWEOZ_27340 [Actinoplanes sp. NPDC004185]
MSIDVYAGGPGRGATSLLHRNRDTDFPDRAGRDLGTHGYDLLDLTYDGATTAGVLGQQLPRLDRRPDLVTITIGGVIEPNAWGAHEIRRTWWRTLQRAGWLPGRSMRG